MEIKKITLETLLIWSLFSAGAIADSECLAINHQTIQPNDSLKKEATVAASNCGKSRLNSLFDTDDQNKDSMIEGNEIKQLTPKAKRRRNRHIRI